MENYLNKSVLILGASELQIPAILSAKKNGIRTIVVDYDPEATGIKYADKFYNISTLDYDGVLKVAKEENIDGIVTICSDRPMNIISKIGSELKLNTISPEAANVATNKAAMRKALKEHNVPIPEFYIIKNFDEFDKVSNEFGYPFIVKPSDNSGSRGITLLKDDSEKLSAYKYAKDNSSDGLVLIEEYMVGKEVSVEIFVSNETIHIIQITDKITTGPPHFVEMGHTQPTNLSLDIQNKIIDVAKKAVQALGINVGPAHVEIKLTDDGPKIVELGARLGGDYITTDLVELSTGFDMVEATVLTSLGINIEPTKLFNRASAIRYFSFNKFINLNKKVISNIERMYVNKININEVMSSRDREAFFITSAENLDKLHEKISIVEDEIL
ncbi:MAG: ATP-grasp domain-containing protein [Clostridia bacterium]|nr:ATP-grasp domain-containing protein [Clostridia bacterium]